MGVWAALQNTRRVRGWGDIDSGPVILGISVAATGFSLAPARALQRPDIFQSLYRSAGIFGLPINFWGSFTFIQAEPLEMLCCWRC